MTDFLFRRSAEQAGLEDVTLKTELSSAQIGLLEEIRQIEKDTRMTQAWTSGSTDIRTYITQERMPYGYRLTRPKNEILAQVQRSRDFIAEKITNIREQTPACVELMEQIRDKAEAILAMS